MSWCQLFIKTTQRESGEWDDVMVGQVERPRRSRSKGEDDSQVVLHFSLLQIKISRFVRLLCAVNVWVNT